MPWLDRLGGAWLLLTVVVLLAGLVSHRIPPFDQFVATNMRMADSLRPQLLLLAVLMALALPLFGLPWTGAGIAALALAGLLALTAGYASRAAPTGERTDLTLVWFNVLSDNPVTADRLEAAIRDSGADVVALSETEPALPLRERLHELYPHRAGCADPEPEHCGIMVLSKYPLTNVTLRDFDTGPERFFRARLDLPDRAPFTLTAVHLTKPWYKGVTETEMSAIEAALQAPRDHPYILMGDFNAAPWSRRLVELETRHGLTHAPRPTPTWPAAVGRFGVPIDHVLLRGGPRLVSLRPWGAELGSNHRGLRAELSLPDTAPDS